MPKNLSKMHMYDINMVKIETIVLEIVGKGGGLFFPKIVLLPSIERSLQLFTTSAYSANAWILN